MKTNMKLRYSKLLIATALFCFFAMVSSAQDVWNLERCINHAMENNIDIRQSKIAIEQANISQTRAKHSRYPSLNANSNLGLNFGRTIDPTNNDFITQSFLSHSYGLSTGVTLFNSGRINNTIKQAGIDKQAAQYNMQQAERDIALFVASTYLNVLFAQENLINTQNQLAVTQEQYNQVRKLIDAGVRPENEILDIDAQIALSEQNIITQKNAITIAMTSLKQILMLDPDYEMILDKPKDVDIISDADVITFNEIYTSALQNQAGIRAAELNMESAIIGEQIAKSALYPSVSLGGNLGTTFSNQAKTLDGGEFVINDQTIFIDDMPVTVGFESFNPNFVNTPYLDQLDQNLSYGFGLGVQIPIYNNYSVKSNIELAKLNTINNSLQIERQKNTLKTNVQQALVDAQAASKSYNAAKKSRDAQKAAFANTQKRYELGAINSFDYVNARNLLDNAEINLIISKYDYLFKAKVVDFYMGRPITLN